LPKELAEVQDTRYQNEKLAAVKIRSLHRSIDTAIEHGVGVGANIVMVDPNHGERIRRVIEDFSPHLDVRILNDLGGGGDIDSHYMVYDFLSKMGATPVEASVTAGSSNARTKYRLPNGRDIHFKQIRPARLSETCGSCSLNNDKDCKEGSAFAYTWTQRAHIKLEYAYSVWTLPCPLRNLPRVVSRATLKNCAIASGNN